MIIEMPRISFFEPREDDDKWPVCMESDYGTDWTICSEPGVIAVTWYDEKHPHGAQINWYCDEHSRAAKYFIEQQLDDMIRRLQAKATVLQTSLSFRLLSDDKKRHKLLKRTA